MRILVAGDSHGNLEDILPKVYKAGEFKISHMIVCGDFGLWTHFSDGVKFLDELNEAAWDNNTQVYAIGGNHENWDHWNWFVENMPTHKGFAKVRSNVLLAPKAHKWSWAGKQFVGAGGAVSVDKAWRLGCERGDKNMLDESGRPPKATGPKTLYWPNEQLEDSDVDEIKKWVRRGDVETVDYLFTHDCSNYSPWKSRMKPDIDSQIHRQRIDEVLKATKPSFHFHGHMHQKYDWINDYSGGGARTIGLEAFKDFNSWGVLDVDSGEWFWPAEYYKALDERAERVAARTSLTV